ncbi:uncharacterized protein M6B38_131395 [Iris pallida]|uniref:rRNA methyltransferase 1, mitochondrial n=1 Tax=Iris pallida TaxID=29817 RepID=A0AAX6G1J6_IRIPA|nr:uncharacterized protein M6B38_131395 [Iris pallida]
MYYYCCNLTRTPKAFPLISSLSLSRPPNPFPNHSSAAAAAAAVLNLRCPSETLVSFIHQQVKALPRPNPNGSRLFSTVGNDDDDDAGGRRRERGSTRQPSPWIISSSSSSSSSSAAAAAAAAASSSYKDKEEKRRQGGGGGRGGLDKKNVRSNPSSSSSSSWEDSADRYFSRNSPPQTKESKQDEKKKNKRITITPQRDSLQEGSYRRNSSLALEDTAEEQQVEPAEEDDAEPIHGPPRRDRTKSNYRAFIDRESRLDKPEVRHWNKQDNWGKHTWKEAIDSSLPKMVGQGIYGVAPVLAALSVERREFYALYVQQGLDLSGNNRKKKKNKDKKGVEKVIKLAQNIGLKVIEASKHDLNMVVDNRPHQGLVLDASPLEMVNIRELEPPASVKGGHKAPIWVALDEVTDPQNLGAIVRSSYFFGVQGVVLCAKNSAPLSGVVSKASAGSLELIEVRSCKNMMHFLSSSIENGWRVLGGSVSTRALSLSEVESGVPTILVLGSEGSGLRPLVERSCTHLVRIPGNMSISECPGEREQEPDEMDQTHPGRELKSFLAVESLNVSVAAGVLLYHLGGNKKHLVDTSSDVAYD